MKKIPLYTAAIIMATCIINYIICNKNGTCKPFPHTTITKCSNNCNSNYSIKYIFRLH